MRTFHAALAVSVLLVAPVAFAASDVTDPGSDERMRIPVTNVAVDPRAAQLGCAAPAVDILSLFADTTANTLVLRMTMADVGAPPRCAGRPLDTAYTNYELDLENANWAVYAIGGTACSGGWSCIRVVKHGEGSFYETVPGATGELLGETWSLRIPLSGKTTNGKSYDLRGQTYELHASTQQKHSLTALTFFDTAGGSDVVLR